MTEKEYKGEKERKQGGVVFKVDFESPPEKPVEAVAYLFDAQEQLLASAPLKGGQADVVYAFPDLSQAGWQEWCSSGEGRDAIFRLFYVAMTRSRESLVLCPQSTPLAVNWR